VAQSRADTPVDIYNVLAGDATFLGYVGEYDFVGGPVSQPALSVTTPNLAIPNLEKIRGLEVLIHDVGTVQPKTFITSDTKPLTTWSVYLILWDGGVGDQLTNAAQRIVSLFVGARSVLTVPVSNTPGVLVQAVVEIPSNAAISA
jgi:hypothetical protein